MFLINCFSAPMELRGLQENLEQLDLSGIAVLSKQLTKRGFHQTMFTGLRSRNDLRAI